MTDREHAFAFYLRSYMENLRLASAYVDAPQTCPHIDPEMLKWELERDWRHLVELIPENVLDDLRL